MAKKKPTKGDWIVRVCIMDVKDFLCTDCTQEEAEDDPFEYSDGAPKYVSGDFEVSEIRPATKAEREGK